MPDVLIVDDDAGVRRALRRALESAGLTCRVAASGRQALARVAEAWPDLVVLDLTLAGALDGWATWATLARARAGRALRVVVLTGDREAVDLALQHGADLALCKSEPAQVVVAALQRLLTEVAV
jgi:CheY-like chemotaxis protein